MATSILDQFIVIELVNKLNRLVDAFSESVIRVVNEDNAQFNDDLEKFSDNLVAIITNNQIGEALNELFTSYEAVGNTALDRLKLSLELFDFGDDDAVIPFSEAQNTNNLTVNLAVRTNALIMAYNNAVQIDFGNQSEVDSVIAQLEDQYSLVVGLTLDDTTRNALTDLRTSSMRFLFDLDLSDVIPIDTELVASTVLAYQYYEDSTRSTEIVSINNILQTGFISGPINILSE